LGDAPRVDSALPISPLDPRQGKIKQEDARELQSVHSSGEADYQVGSFWPCQYHLCVPLGCSLPHMCLQCIYSCDGSWWPILYPLFVGRLTIRWVMFVLSVAPLCCHRAGSCQICVCIVYTVITVPEFSFACFAPLVCGG